MTHARRLLSILALGLLAGATASAQTPPALRALIESPAGRHLFEEALEGRALVETLAGATVAPGARVDELLRVLDTRPGLRDLKLTLEQRLQRIRIDLEPQLGERGRALFGETPGAAVTLAAQELALLRGAAATHLRAEVIDFLEAFRPRGYGAARNRFTGLAAAQLRAETVLSLRAARPDGAVARSMSAYEAWAANEPAFGRWLPRTSVEHVLADEAAPAYAERLAHVLERARESNLSGGGAARLARALDRELRELVPAAGRAERVRRLRAGGLSPAQLRRALGEMDLAETKAFVFGTDPLQPSADSLIGRYLRETGAASIVRTFPKGPQTFEQGPPVLVVALSPESFDTYRRLFSGENLFVHVHNPGQGTLRMGYRGLTGTYARFDQEFRAPGPGTILPHIVLKSSEAQRMRNFAALGRLDGNKAMRPWEIPGYCARGGYNSCTHWVGNIPVGDRRLARYTFPGNVDQWAGGAAGPGPQSQRLNPYDARPVPGIPSDLVQAYRHVWKTPGHEQLSDVIGLRRQNLAGEMANPGYVAYSLINFADRERVPVVFYMTGDHRAAIPADFAHGIQAH